MSRDYISCADTAKLVRQALKLNFPGVKFRVRSDTYSMGASIDVSWIDGPFTTEVDRVVQRFAGATFDGMTDMKEYHSELQALPDGSVREVRYGADFIFTGRECTPECMAPIVSRTCKKYGYDVPRMILRESFRFKGVMVVSGYDPDADLTGSHRYGSDWRLSDLIHRELADMAREAVAAFVNINSDF